MTLAGRRSAASGILGTQSSPPQPEGDAVITTKRIAFAVAVLAICGLTFGAPTALAQADSLNSQEQGTKTTAHGRNGMVSTAHPLVARAALAVLKNGGNALDAPLVGAIMQTVVEPQMTTLAGAMSVLYFDAKSGRYYYLNAELDHTRSGAQLKP